MKKLTGIFVMIILLAACGGNKQNKTEENEPAEKTTTNAQPENTDWEAVHNSIANIESYDGDRILEKGQGFFVAENLLATKYSLINQATVVKVMPFGDNKTYTADKFVAFDRINDLIILEVEGIQKEPIELFPGEAPRSAKSMYVAPKTGPTIQLFSGQILNLASVRGTKLYRITNRIRKSQFGTPIFVSNKKAIGIAWSGNVSYEMQSFAIPVFYLAEMLKNRKQTPESLATLSLTANAATAAENSKIKGIVLETDYGNITIRLFNETPAYRDNFIRLAKEQYFDSLLIHRVIADFGIQTGAADSRYAEPGISVGWKGPGYTLPAHIVDGLYHKRGMIGSPREPDSENQRRRSDGSQFYIVTGRKYFDKELDDIEEQNGYKFTPEQRRVYKTIGGAPHLDGSYTVFGQVISGMDVADKIVQVETNQRWRPVEDIRLRKVRILK